MAKRVRQERSTSGLIQLTPLYIVKATQVIPVIRYEEGDELIHTDEYPQCGDDTCPCHANIVDGSLVDSFPMSNQAQAKEARA